MPHLQRAIYLKLFIFLSFFFSGCEQQQTAKTIKLRPVLTLRTNQQTLNAKQQFAGVVHAHFQTPLAFRVPGKVLKRYINLGDSVLKGQLLAILDNKDYQLAADTLNAQLKAAQLDLKFSQDNLQRFQDLAKQKLISDAELEKVFTSHHSAKERVLALKSQYQQALQQLSYCELKADAEGFITEVAVEDSQIVQAGQTALIEATGQEKQVLIYVPEQFVNQIHVGQSATVEIWSNQQQTLNASIREIAKQADALSRTYAVKVKLPKTNESIALGMTASVTLEFEQSSEIVIPLGAVFEPMEEKSQHRVWLVNETQKTVESVPVTLGSSFNDENISVIGLSVGQLIVIKGVHHLEEGQSIRILNESDKDG